MASPSAVQRFLVAYEEEEIVAMTGISSDTFSTLYEKYCGPGTPICKPRQLWWLFQYLKLYPINRACRVLHEGRVKSRRNFMSRIYRWQRYLAGCIDELSEAWANRKELSNMLPHVFDRSVTGSVDSFPIVINRPKKNQRIFYNGKYGCHVVKVQGVCDHRGNIIWYSGPHVGVTSDIELFRHYTPPLDAGERLLGDKAYVGLPDQVIAPFKKRRDEDRLQGRRWHFNNVHAWYRATIEHCFAFVKRFRILNTVFRGHITKDASHLSHALKIIMHSNYLHTRGHPQRTHQDMDLTLDEVDATDAGPVDPLLGTGARIEDFNVGDRVQIWHVGSWWHGKVTYKSRAGTISVRLVGARHAMTGIAPSSVRLAN